MKHLIVYAHPNPKSFNHAILETTVKELENKGHQVVVRDLYSLHFNPILSGSDFEAFHAGTVPADIKQEQNYISTADVIMLIYPIWWAGLPAMIKGYIDRVFSYGFAYKYGDEGTPVGLLAGKKGFVINTQGTPGEYYDSTGMTDALKKTSDTGILSFCGIESLGHVFFGAVPAVDDATRRDMLDTLKNKLKGIF